MAITRLSDGAKFAIGDFVTNGTQMRGKIEEFDMEPAANAAKPYNDLFIYTDWSGIGMNLDSVQHVSNPARIEVKPHEAMPSMPSKFQPGDFCGMKLGKRDVIMAKVTKTAFTIGKVLYDLEIGVGDGEVTRIHSLDSVFVVNLPGSGATRLGE